MYDGVVSVRLEGVESKALALVPDAKALLSKVQAVKDRAQVSTFSMSMRVDDFTYIYALSAGDTNVVLVSSYPDVVDEVAPEETPPIPEPRFPPNFYSGFVYGGTLETRKKMVGRKETTYQVCAKFSPTPGCAKHHKLSAGRQDSVRLAVAPHSLLPELGETSGPKALSQYTRLRSSMYSGTMKAVAQVVMGMGKLRKEHILPTEQRFWTKGIVTYAKEVENNGVQVRFDYKFHRTHGITKGADDRLWLIEISIAKGVLARPLPVFEAFSAPSAVEAARNGGDEAMAVALETLGCLPTGEAFPLGAGLTKAIAAGDVLQLMTPDQLEPIYRCSPYSSASGWAFNTSGSEAHNTAYYFGDDGFQRGVWYQINIRLGAIKQEREKNEPIATGTAELRRNSEGFLYCPPAPGRSPARYVPIKFYEPLLPGLLSHEGVPSEEARGLPVPDVDTVMFVAFHGDELKTVRHYRKSKTDIVEEIDDPRYPGECLLASQWTITKTTGIRSLPAMMYSNDIDDRKVLAEHVETTHIRSDDLGFDPPKFSDYIQSPESCFVWRERIFRRTTEYESAGGEQIGSAVAIPQYSREAYYYAFFRRFWAGRWGTTSVTYDAVIDPNVGYGWRCFPRINPPPFPYEYTFRCRGEGTCTLGGSGVHQERRVVHTFYQPNPSSSVPWVIGNGTNDCHQFADSGQWLTLCQTLDGFNQPGMDRPSSSTGWHKGADESGTLKLFTPSHGGGIEIPVTYSQVANHWMTPSPDPETGIVQFIYAEHSALSEDAIVYATNLSSYSGETLVRGYTPDAVGPTDGYPAFIGVNQP